MSRPTFPAPPPWSSRLLTVGVTGTNGKTSTTMLTAGALAELCSPVAQTTTLGSFLGREPFAASTDLPGFLATMRAGLQAGGRFAAVELTSEALGLGFARTWPFAVGVFTNLTRDHLDAHGSAEHYLACKAQLFMALPPGGTAVLNSCDPAAALLAEVVPEQAVIRYFGALSRGEPRAEPDLSATRIEPSWEGTAFSLEARQPCAGLPERLQIRAIGEVYAENALAALLAAGAAGVPWDLAARGLGAAPAAPGRFEVVGTGAGTEPHVVVDFAHSPDALRRTLQTARRLCSGTLTVIFGAGGDRDRAKRPLMGEAAQLADRVVLTSDNPRSEDPGAIAHQIREGLTDHGQVTLQLDRTAAVRAAVIAAEPRDVIVIAGRGPETVQHLGGRRVPLSDRQLALAALQQRRR